MASKDPRKTVSMTGDLYRRAKKHCENRGLSLAGLVTDLLEEHLRKTEVERLGTGWPPPRPVFENMDLRGEGDSAAYGGSGHMI